MRSIFISIVLILTQTIVFQCFSQEKPMIRMASNRDRILLGEQFELSIELKIPSSVKRMQWPLIPDTIQHLEVVSRGTIDSSVSGIYRKYRQVIIMTGFDSGSWKLPIIKYPLGKEILQSNMVQVDVLPVSLKGNDYHDIHEIIEVEKPPFQWWKVWLFTALALLILYIVLIYKRKKTNLKPEQTSQIFLGSFDEAIRQMNQLKEEKLVEKGEMKRYFIKLYDILRVYMTVKYTDDMVMGLLRSLEKEQALRGVQGLRVCEAVKFAKYGSSPSEADNVWREFYRLLELLNAKKTLK